MTSESEGWPTEVAATIAAEVRRHRKRKGWSMQRLSDEVARYGVKLPRAVLSNFEFGRRPTVSVAELEALAAALEVPPALLRYPLGHVDEVEPLAGLRTSPAAALRWAIGETELPGHPLDSELGDQISRFLRHERLVDRWFALRDEAEQYREQAATEPDETEIPDGTLVRRGSPLQFDPDFARKAIEEAEQRMGLTATRIRQQRAEIGRAGLVPPPLPPELADLDKDETQGGGGDEQ